MAEREGSKFWEATGAVAIGGAVLLAIIAALASL